MLVDVLDQVVQVHPHAHLAMSRPLMRTGFVLEVTGEEYCQVLGGLTLAPENGRGVRTYRTKATD